MYKIKAPKQYLVEFVNKVTHLHMGTQHSMYIFGFPCKMEY